MFTIKSKSKRTSDTENRIMAKYTICGKTIRFSSNFYEKMDSYYWIIKDMEVLVFDDSQSIICSKFRHPIVLHRFIVQVIFGNGFNRHVVLTSNIKHVEFGGSFNKCVDLPKKIQSLTYGDHFNKSIRLPSNLQCLSFGSGFNQLIFLTPKITNVSFGANFNQPIVLNAKIKYLHFGHKFNQPITLTRQITDVSFGSEFIQPVILMPDVKTLTIKSANYWLIDGLTDWMDNLNLGNCFDEPLNNISNSITLVHYTNVKYKYRHLIPRDIIW